MDVLIFIASLGTTNSFQEVDLTIKYMYQLMFSMNIAMCFFWTQEIERKLKTFKTNKSIHI